MQQPAKSRHFELPCQKKVDQYAYGIRSLDCGPIQYQLNLLATLFPTALTLSAALNSTNQAVDAARRRFART